MGKFKNGVMEVSPNINQNNNGTLIYYFNIYLLHKVTRGNFDRWGTLKPFSFQHFQLNVTCSSNSFDWSVCATIWGVGRYVSHDRSGDFKTI